MSRLYTDVLEELSNQSSTALIFLEASLILMDQSKGRDDIWPELSWWTFYMASIYCVGMSDNHKSMVANRSRLPINALLERAYAEGIICR